jgi:sugar lactone lactonase YvrE
VAQPREVLTGLVMGESARWHDGQLWFCDWGAGEVIRLDGSSPQVVAGMSGLPFGIDWLPAPGLIAVVTPDGKGRQVADGLEFPNGMAVTADDRTLIVAESHASRLTAFDIDPDGSLSNRRVWAELPGVAPDGICLDPSGAIWHAAVPHQHCQLVREGGDVLVTVALPDGAFDGALSGDGRTLYALTADYSNPAAMFGGRTGRLFAISLDSL